MMRGIVQVAGNCKWTSKTVKKGGLLSYDIVDCTIYELENIESEILGLS